MTTKVIYIRPDDVDIFNFDALFGVPKDERIERASTLPCDVLTLAEFEQMFNDGMISDEGYIYFATT